MTDKELRKLKRPKLIEMMLFQSRELLEKNNRIEELTRSCEEAQQTLERLKKRLDDRDAEIAALARRVPMEGAPDVEIPGGTVTMEELLSALKEALRHVAEDKQAGGGEDD